MPPPAARPGGVKPEAATAEAGGVSVTRCATLTGHTSEVFICSWSPADQQQGEGGNNALLLASGSGDGTARIWEVPPPPPGGRAAGEAAKVPPPRVLRHAAAGSGSGGNGSDGGAATATANANNNAAAKSPQSSGGQCDVTTLDWHPSGSLLATGSYDGAARVWSRDGALRATLRGHGGPIFSLRWSRGGRYLLSGGVDKTAAVWDVDLASAAGDASGSPDAGLVRRWAHHAGSTLDVDWRDDATFATCSSDATVAICRVPSSSAGGGGGGASLPPAQPLLRFAAHADEVNAVRWDPSGALLASCSDDATAKLWRYDEAEADARAVELEERQAEGNGNGAHAPSPSTTTTPKPLHELKGHSKEIYTLRWGPGSSGGGGAATPAQLATASFDATVKLWDAETGACVRTLGPHGDAVYALAFSPDGRMLATGSFDGRVRVWSAEGGSGAGAGGEAHLLREHKADGGVFELSWSRDGTMVAASTNAHTVAVCDVRR